MPARCSRCGAALPIEPELPCWQCWEAHGDERLVRLLVHRAEEGSRRAPQLLAAIGDPAAAPELREAMSHQDPHIRAAAISSIGWSGEPSDVPAVAAATEDADEAVRTAARATLADLGGQEAAEALAADLDGLDEDEHAHAVEALAWLGDIRAIEPLHELVAESLDGSGLYRGRGVLSALARLGSGEDVLRMIGTVTRVVADGAASPGTPEFWRAQEAATQLRVALSEDRPEFLEEAGAQLREVAPELPAIAHWGGRSAKPRVVDVGPLGKRSVPRATLAELSETPVPGVASPPPKFGGQPDWVEAPAWPLGADSAPLVFFGQLPVTAGDQARTAYVFIDPEGNHWEPLGEANAVLLQPGAPCQLETAPLSTGPRLFEFVHEAGQFRRRWRARPYERFIRLEDGLDPERWEWPELPPETYRKDEPGDWKKLGGTPLFLQGEESPPGDGWSFAFQFSAAWAGRELGDGAACYGFVRDDGAGAFLWQCH
jgi:HEAT repeat protein